MTPIARISPTERRGSAIEGSHDITGARAGEHGHAVRGTRDAEPYAQGYPAPEERDRVVAPFHDEDGALGPALPQSETRHLDRERGTEEAVQVGMQKEAP